MERHFISCNDRPNGYCLIRGSFLPQSYLGQAEAEIEWTPDKEQVNSDLFVHTASYELSKSDDCLILFGRRGTGKTALFKMLHHDVTTHSSQHYHYSIIISQEDLFYKITSNLRNLYVATDDMDELMHVLRGKWEWVIYSSAMLALYEKKEFIEREKTEELNDIRCYLSDAGFLNVKSKSVSHSPLDWALDIFTKVFEDIQAETLSVGTALSQSIDLLLNSHNYKAAISSMGKILSSRGERCMVLIDSQEYYKFSDKITEATVAGLMDAVWSVFRESAIHRVIAKAAFPSEIRHRVRPVHHARLQQRTHVIFWQYNDLLQLIAKRFNRLLFGVTEEMDANPEEFLSQFLPTTTLSYSDMQFATLPYIISHTQKTPRQLIQLLNIILTLAKINQMPFHAIEPDCVREGTNVRIHDLSMGVLDMYSKIYPRADEIVGKTLLAGKNIFSYSEFHKLLQKSSSIRGQAQLDQIDTERLFVEAGIVGIWKNESDYFGTKSFLQAEYEYQLTNTLHLSKGDTLVVHPMFYQQFSMRVDVNSLVYPKPSALEQNEIKLIAQNRRSNPNRNT